jgi:SAM-dependent methyltransferase
LGTSARVDSTWEETFAGLYWKLGPETKTAIVDLLPDDWSFEGKRILDFGCGPGRTLRHFLSEADVAEIWGVDIDAESIELLKREHCPPLHALRSGYAPPLGLDYDSFDLAWAISVFTHLTDNSIPWLLELHRLLRPGGLLIATYMGRGHSEMLTGEPWDEDKVGMNVLRHSQSRERGGPQVMMSDWWVRAHWGRAFEILHIEPQIHNQSWAVMRKLDVQLTAEEVERPENDSREYVAARENLRQVQRELEAVQQELVTARGELEHARREHAAGASDVRGEYENSLSWQITSPLREGRRLIRSIRSRRVR